MKSQAGHDSISLLCKYEDQSLDSQHLHKSWVLWYIQVIPMLLTLIFNLNIFCFFCHYYPLSQNLQTHSLYSIPGFASRNQTKDCPPPKENTGPLLLILALNYENRSLGSSISVISGAGIAPLGSVSALFLW